MLEHLEPEEIFNILDNIINKPFKVTENVTIVHGVTSKEARRSLLSYFKDKSKALNNYWYAIVAAYLTV